MAVFAEQEAPAEEEKAPEQKLSSENFTEGEAPEVGPVVAEALSRGATPPAEMGPITVPEDERPQPKTPDESGRFPTFVFAAPAYHNDALRCHPCSARNKHFC